MVYRHETPARSMIQALEMPFKWLMACFVVTMTFTINATHAARPNIVFILADDLGYGDLASYGHPYARTPNLDQLAAEGTLFKNFHVAGSACAPSRTGFMTGRNPAGFANLPKFFGFQGYATVTEILKGAGYATGHFGKWHIGPDAKNGTYGIDSIRKIGSDRDNPEGRDARVFDAAITYIEENKAVPFYVNIWAHISHHKVKPPASLKKKFNDVTVDRKDFDKHMNQKLDDYKSLGGDIDDGMRNYLADVWSLDFQVGKLMSKIDELKLRDNTIIVFSSDQGAGLLTKDGKKHELLENQMGYSGGYRGGKHSYWEGGVRVPFIVRWPGQVPAQKINESSLFSSLDWLPTISAIAGVKLDASAFEGEDVTDIWMGDNRYRKEPLFWKATYAKSQTVMFDGRYKLLIESGEAQLYDISSDRGEFNNIAKDNKAIVDQLAQKLNSWNKTLPGDYAKRGDKPFPVSPPENPVLGYR